jgi:hypothetical protein
VLTDAAGLTAIFDELRSQLTVKAPSLRMLAQMQEANTARDAIDAASCITI